MAHYQQIILHIPHSSPVFPIGYEDWSGGIDKDIIRWTDWFTDWLFSSAAVDNNHIIPVAFPFSRFFCDVERLIGDPLESVGQGIIYTDFGQNHRDISDERIKELRKRFYALHDIEALLAVGVPAFGQEPEQDGKRHMIIRYAQD